MPPATRPRSALGTDYRPCPLGTAGCAPHRRRRPSLSSGVGEVAGRLEGCDPLVQRLQRRLEGLHGGLVPGGERVIMRLEEGDLPGRVLRPGLTPP